MRRQRQQLVAEEEWRIWLGVALMAIWQHNGRPHATTDQPHIEKFFGHFRGYWPHPEEIDAPVAREAELHPLRTNTTGYASTPEIGYVTLDDERYGRGPAIRRAGKRGSQVAPSRIDHTTLPKMICTGERP